MPSKRVRIRARDGGVRVTSTKSSHFGSQVLKSDPVRLWNRGLDSPDRIKGRLKEAVRSRFNMYHSLTVNSADGAID